MRRTITFAAGVAATALSLTGLLALSAGATTPVGPPAPSPAPPPENILAGPLRARADGISLRVTDDAVVRDFTLTYRPGDDSGWHQHPGIVLATVQAGTVLRTLPCRRPQAFTVGQAFTEVGPHFVENRGSTDAVLSITQIAPAGTTGTAFREDLPAPTCRHHPHH
jgi:quercetin dioxygenase-like cupin family protein